MFVFPETASCTCPFNYFPIQAKQVNKLKSFIYDLVMGTIKHINKTNLGRVGRRCPLLRHIVKLI